MYDKKKMSYGKEMKYEKGYKDSEIGKGLKAGIEAKIGDTAPNVKKTKTVKMGY